MRRNQTSIYVSCVVVWREAKMGISDTLRRINHYLELFDIMGGVITSILVYTAYFYILLLAKLVVSVIKFRIILWRKRLPRRLRLRLISVYEDKIEELISSTYRGFLEIRLLNKLYYIGET